VLGFEGHGFMKARGQANLELPAVAGTAARHRDCLAEGERCLHPCSHRFGDHRHGFFWRIALAQAARAGPSPSCRCRAAGGAEAVGVHR